MIRLRERKMRKLERNSTKLKDMLYHVAQRLSTYIAVGNNMRENSEEARLFKEAPHIDRLCRVRVYGGFVATIPQDFHYRVHKISVPPPSVAKIVEFLECVFNTVQLPFECAVIALIYIERVIVSHDACLHGVEQRSATKHVHMAEDRVHLLCPGVQVLGRRECLEHRLR